MSWLRPSAYAPSGWQRGDAARLRNDDGRVFECLIDDVDEGLYFCHPRHFGRRDRGQHCPVPSLSDPGLIYREADRASSSRNTNTYIRSRRGHRVHSRSPNDRIRALGGSPFSWCAWHAMNPSRQPCNAFFSWNRWLMDHDIIADEAPPPMRRKGGPAHRPPALGLEPTERWFDMDPAPSDLRPVDVPHVEPYFRRQRPASSIFSDSIHLRPARAARHRPTRRQDDDDFDPIPPLPSQPPPPLPNSRHHLEEDSSESDAGSISRPPTLPRDMTRPAERTRSSRRHRSVAFQDQAMSEESDSELSDPPTPLMGSHLASESDDDDTYGHARGVSSLQDSRDNFPPPPREPAPPVPLRWDDEPLSQPPPGAQVQRGGQWAQSRATATKSDAAESSRLLQQFRGYGGLEAAEALSDAASSSEDGDGAQSPPMPIAAATMREVELEVFDEGELTDDEDDESIILFDDDEDEADEDDADSMRHHARNTGQALASHQEEFEYDDEEDEDEEGEGTDSDDRDGADDMDVFESRTSRDEPADIVPAHSPRKSTTSVFADSPGTEVLLLAERVSLGAEDDSDAERNDVAETPLDGAEQQEDHVAVAMTRRRRLSTDHTQGRTSRTVRRKSQGFALGTMDTKRRQSQATAKPTFLSKTSLDRIAAAAGSAIIGYFYYHVYVFWLTLVSSGLLMILVMGWLGIRDKDNLTSTTDVHISVGNQILTGRGAFQDSELFYGYYSLTSENFNLALAYFLLLPTVMVVVLLQLLYALERSFQKDSPSNESSSLNPFGALVFTSWSHSISRLDVVRRAHSAFKCVGRGNRPELNRLHRLSSAQVHGQPDPLLWAPWFPAESAPANCSTNTSTLPSPPCWRAASLHQQRAWRWELSVSLLGCAGIVGTYIVNFLRLHPVSTTTCWETRTGQEFYRLFVLDVFVRAWSALTVSFGANPPSFNVTGYVLGIFYRQACALTPLCYACPLRLPSAVGGIGLGWLSYLFVVALLSMACGCFLIFVREIGSCGPFYAVTQQETFNTTGVEIKRMYDIVDYAVARGDRGFRSLWEFLFSRGVVVPILLVCGAWMLYVRSRFHAETLRVAELSDWLAHERASTREYVRRYAQIKRQRMQRLEEQRKSTAHEK
ncbi:uncharacterized protein MONBRDRAFT_4964 [Monosiga brevicollis MX1]|uniref:TMC domain-containing protein n=1 Tax=Monosiga brevicollis TaxID=81824 RepID=A9UPH3_MONBE|nr:uncharacterized protein MONBRDRAFT_4964 [Monosiga brevicollis MX1]EDQ92423.1 predicted protein [Monosiga brevicollis MX1]|eukprot:XP_001742185.1 hypothetical protein [Monosiga brevicollis MX1]